MFENMSLVELNDELGRLLEELEKDLKAMGYLNDD